MCRNIKILRNASVPPTEEEIALAALQYVRKVSGYRSPSRANKEAFDVAVLEIAESTRRLLDGLVFPVSTSTTTIQVNQPREHKAS
jgi:hypothetical protein